MTSDCLDLGRNRIYNKTEDEVAKKVYHQIANGRDFMLSFDTKLHNKLKEVRDNDEEVGNHVHDDCHFICHNVVHRPNKFYHPADAPD